MGHEIKTYWWYATLFQLILFVTLLKMFMYCTTYSVHMNICNVIQQSCF